MAMLPLVDYIGDQILFCGDVIERSADGDTLFVPGIGRVLDGRLDGHPAFVVSYWRDPFVIPGGTGKYEEATGEIVTDDYNSSEDPNSHHHRKGTITMKKGKR